VPLVGGQLGQLEQRYEWASDADWRAGYQVIAELQEQLFMSLNCVQKLIDEQQRLYRLWDTALNGTQYSEAGGVVTPELPAVPPASASEANAMRAHIGRIWHLAENSVAGQTAAAGEGIAGAPALTDDQTVRQLLRRLIAGLDGNTDPAPVDNLLMALRGTTIASSTRNVIDSNGATLTTLLDQVETLLTEIRDKLV
jgi:hypothetical protein